MVKVRRAHPRDDLASALVLAEKAGDQLSEDELLSMFLLLLVAGHETTANLIGTNGFFNSPNISFQVFLTAVTQGIHANDPIPDGGVQAPETLAALGQVA